jgi:hypothetical protein
VNLIAIKQVSLAVIVAILHFQGILINLSFYNQSQPPLPISLYSLIRQHVPVEVLTVTKKGDNRKEMKETHPLRLTKDSFSLFYSHSGLPIWGI